MKNINFFKRGFMLAIAIMSVSQITFAQDRWSLEVRPGANFATKKLGDANLKTGYGIEGTVAYRFMPHLALYAGWSWNRFASSDQSFAGTNMDFEETGYTYGLQFVHPIGQSKINVLARAGGLANHIEVENSDGKIISDSGHGFGWQAEGGVSIPLGEKFRILPSIRYRSLSRDLKIVDRTTSVDLNCLSVGVGFSWVF
jgi:long-subunit fatty acid transport protein